MRKKIFNIVLAVILAFPVFAQNEKAALSWYVSAVQNAYDNNSDSLEYYAANALPLALKLNDIKAQITTQRLYAIKLFLNSEPDKAAKILLDLIRAAEKYPPSNETALLYYSAAQVYSKNDYAKAGEKYLRTGVAIAMELKNDTVISDGYNRMGIVFEREENLDSAMYYYQKSLYYNDRSGALLGKAYSLENIAGIYAAKNDLASALNAQRQALGYKLQYGKKIDLSMAYINIAETFVKLKQYDSAIDYTRIALALSTEIKYRDLERYCYQLLSEIFEKRGDFKTALLYLRQYSLTNDTAYNETKTRQLAEQNAKYQTEKHERKIQELSQQATIQSLKLRQRNIFLLIAVGLLVAGAAIVYLLYNRRRYKEQVKLQTEINKQQNITTREVLNAEERERKRIAADLHDGVGQLLSATLINMETLFTRLDIDKRTDPQADRIFGLVTESYDELRSISHQMMPNALLKTGLGSAIKELIAGIDSNKLEISYEAVGLDQRLSEEVETVLYRVIQESINNVIKHARAGKLNISLIKDEDGISATIEDNGVGFDQKHTSMNGIGMKNMFSRVHFINGTVDIDSHPGRGTLIAIHIPLDTGA